MSKPERDKYGCQHEFDQERAEQAEEARAHEGGICGGILHCCLICLRAWEEKAGNYDSHFSAGPRTLMKRRMMER